MSTKKAHAKTSFFTKPAGSSTKPREPWQQGAKPQMQMVLADRSEDEDDEDEEVSSDGNEKQTNSDKGGFTKFTEDEEMEEGGGDEAADVEVDKDSDEEELERLVFGDKRTFREGIKGFQAPKQAVDEEDEEDVADQGDAALEEIPDHELFVSDFGAAPQTSTTLVPTGDEEDSDVDELGEAAWHDSDDERLVVSIASVPRLRKLRITEDEDFITGKEYIKRLRQQYERLNPSPDWATEARTLKKRKSTADADSSDEDLTSPTTQPLTQLLRNASLLTAQPPTKRRKLRPETLDIQRLRDIGTPQPSSITSLSHHPTLPLLLSSGPSSTLYLHHLTTSDPANPNPLLTSLHIKSTPLTTTAFHPTTSRIFLSARRRYFHIWDLSSGRVEKISRVYGHAHEQRSMERFKLSPDGLHVALLGSGRKGGGVVNILDAGTLQWVAQMRVESKGGVADFCWWSDGKGLCVAGKNGEVSEWGLEERRVVARWQDEGAVGTTVMALGGSVALQGKEKHALGSDRWVAVGSSSGIVNVYDRREWLQNPEKVPAHPKPTKSFDQLVTPVSVLAFSPDGQVMCMASQWKKDALRLVHLPSCTLYRNWPTSNTPLGRVTAVAWGQRQDGLVLCVGNEQGRLKGWEVRY